MKALLQPGSCWLALVGGQCVVVKIGPQAQSCLFPGNNTEQPLDRVEEWLVPVWTSRMALCTRCLVAAAHRMQCSCQGLSLSQASPVVSSFWVVFLDNDPEVIQVTTHGGRLTGRTEIIPLPKAERWLLQVWGPEMFYCIGCNQILPKRDAVFQTAHSFKAVCKECSEQLELDEEPNG